MARIGVYGGSFNPPHIGHIQAAREAVAALNLDRMILIPAGIAPHKSLPEVSANSRQRLEMLKIALAGAPELELSAMELERDYGLNFVEDGTPADGENASRCR